jgi:hypothetical protein
LVHASNPSLFLAVRRKTKTNGTAKWGGSGAVASKTIFRLNWYRGLPLLVPRTFSIGAEVLLVQIISLDQRVSNDLWRTRPPRCRMSWISPPPPLFRQQVKGLVACCHSFNLWVPCRKSNSGLPYSNPTRCCMSHATPCLSYAAPLSEPRRTLT